MPRYTERVPAEPFARWLQQRYEYHRARLAGPCDNGGDRGAHIALAQELGWNGQAGERRLFRYRHMRKETSRGLKPNGKKRLVVMPQTEFPRSEVEDALHMAGYRFADVYPEIAQAEDIPLEPEAWCWDCMDLVTPVGGDCPWCVGRREFEALRRRHAAEKRYRDGLRAARQEAA